MSSYNLYPLGSPERSEACIDGRVLVRYVMRDVMRYVMRKKRKLKKKNENYSFIFLVVSPLEEFKTFSEKTRKKIKNLFYVKNFAQFFFQRFLDFLRSVEVVIWSIF